MQKISKKIILIKNLNKIDFIFNTNFYLVSATNISDINKELNLSVYKKGLYRYILPGRFLKSIKYYFPNHTYINFDFKKDFFSQLIKNQNIILYKYNNLIFLNNLLILRHSVVNLNFEFFNNICVLKKFFLLCLLFYIS